MSIRQNYSSLLIEEAQYWDNINEIRNERGVTPEIDFHSPSGIYPVPYIEKSSKLQKLSYPYWKTYYYTNMDRLICKPLKRLYYENLPLKTGNNGSALEIACGPGAWAVEIARRGFEVDAFDISAATINIAQNHIINLHGLNEYLKINYFVSDANTVNLQEKKYSFILMQSAIHHIMNGEYILREAFKSLNIGGTLLIIESNRKNIFSKMITSALLLILPTIPSFKCKIDYYFRIIISKFSKSEINNNLVNGESPFEDVTPIGTVLKILNKIQLNYSIETTGIFCTDVIPHIPQFRFRNVLVRLLGNIDWLLNKIFKMTGKYIIIKVIKENEGKQRNILSI